MMKITGLPLVYFRIQDEEYPKFVNINYPGEKKFYKLKAIFFWDCSLARRFLFFWMLGYYFNNIDPKVTHS